MPEVISTFVSKSKELKLTFNSESRIVEIVQGDMKLTTIDEYLDFVGRVGDALEAHNTGKVLFDTRQLRNYNIDYRSSAVNNLQRLLLDKAPYFLLAAIKGPSVFENAGLQVAISVSKKLSKKFIDGKMFDERDAALQWLSGYNYK